MWSRRLFSVSQRQRTGTRPWACNISSCGGARSSVALISADRWGDDGSKLSWYLAASLLGGILVATNQSPSGCDSNRVIPRSEVTKHKTKEAGIWVMYGDGVYDISEFIANHPGGASKIILAAGGNLEPFWNLYGVHKKQQVLDILAEFRIGTLPPEDVQPAEAKGSSNDPYFNDPPRHPALIPASKQPFNAEPPPELLMDAGFVTPNELYYVRNHLPVPIIDEGTYRLEVAIEGGRTINLSLQELKSLFPTYKVTTAVQCAGNRRNEMTAVKPVKGLNWTGTAISNCEWTGVRLRDVLIYAGLDAESLDSGKSPIQHIQFEGLDHDMTTCYGSSIYADKAMDPKGDVLLAFEMNGSPIPRDHGFPVRAVVPGVVGARNVKWLGRIIASETESQNHWQQKDYKSFSPNIDWHNVDFSTAPAIEDMPVVSTICSPTPGTVISPHDDSVTVKGYAWSGGGRGIVRVDVSCDDGVTWQTASLKPTGQPVHRTWAWTLWEAEIPVPKELKEAGNGEMKVLCRAVDSAYNTQPERVEPIWNLRGVLTNHWHRVNLVVAEENE